MFRSTKDPPMLQIMLHQVCTLWHHWILGLCCLLLSWSFLTSKYPPFNTGLTTLCPFTIEADLKSEMATITKEHTYYDQVNINWNSISMLVQSGRQIQTHSLTAILPVSMDSFTSLPDTLLPFLRPSVFIKEVFVVCSDALASEVRRVLRQLVVKAGHLDHPEISLWLWPIGGDIVPATLKIAADVLTDWVLVMDYNGLQGVDEYFQHRLLQPLAIPLPSGPLGQVTQYLMDSRKGQIQPATYLSPPFVMPSILARRDVKLPTISTWESFGQRISQGRDDKLAGVLWAYKNETYELQSERLGSIYNDEHLFDFEFSTGMPQIMTDGEEDKNLSSAASVLLPSWQDLISISQLLCEFQSRNFGFRVLLYQRTTSGIDSTILEEGVITTEGCTIKYDFLSDHSLLAVDNNKYHMAVKWLTNFPYRPSVVILLKEEVVLSAMLKDALSNSVPMVSMPRADLPYCHWMASLSNEEWKNWHIPHVDVIIITKDRPSSLVRLLTSLHNGLYFGDAINLRLSIEQNCDLETLKVIQSLHWPHGSISVHHRVIHGGLLPSVVESWYPHSNNSYGLTLEDDVEISPLFYAWIKMNLLRYRHGDPSNKSPLLFGISLYQQKNTELHMKGRRAFDARKLFSESGLQFPSSPYLSPIPCSWGAVYFPEQWREFHDYLAMRFAEIYMDIDVVVVPDVRSNGWTESWKKYYIELVYLRGYVMLYPNYSNYTSLSTNHLEAGSHVKHPTLEKQELFLLPLMQLPSNVNTIGLLELPEGKLPSWQSLPVLNLTGGTTKLESLVRSGQLRQNDIVSCSGDWHFRDLTCESTLA